MSDPRKYRTKEEEQEYINHDPIEKVLSVIRKNKYATEEEIEAIYSEISIQVEDAVKFAEESPLPSPEDMFLDVYEQEDYPFIKD
jgi:pyruvate dehydrogenase E1 component alpha subunit